MSRKYVNEKWCVRCGKTEPTPYLRDNLKHIQPEGKTIIDIGCGNGRNSAFMFKCGAAGVASVDMVNDYGDKIVLGHDKFPYQDNTFDIVLMNYILMFLSPEEREQVYSEVMRTAKDGAIVVCELYAAKDSFAKNKEELIVLRDEVHAGLWVPEKIRFSRERFIVKLDKSLYNLA